MNIAFVTNEVYPFQKHGGLADISASLPKTLNDRGHNITTILPFYDDDPYQAKFKLITKQDIILGDHIEPTEFYSYTHNKVRHIFIKNSLFSILDEKKEALRYLVFSIAALESLKLIDHTIEILHINNWHTGFIPYLLDSNYRKDDKYKNIKTLLTIHNIEKQGIFEREIERYLPFRNFTYILNGQINFLKTGIMRSNSINTVSKTYRKEILLRFFSFDLDSALKSRQDNLFGILNGFDHNSYNPKKENLIPYNYSFSNYKDGKIKNKKFLIEKLNFDKNIEKPMLLFIGRLGRQKGIDLFKEKIQKLLKNKDIYFVVIGEGELKFEAFFRELEKDFPKLVHYHSGFDQKISHQAYAASDFFLLPSLFEPCGLNHMIAMRYGTLPIVRETGGLKDTVFEDTENQNGYTFKNYTVDEFNSTLDRALKEYKEKTIKKIKIENAMNVTSFLNDMAKQYEDLYKKID